MNISNDKIESIGKLVLQCEDVAENEWDSLSFVFDVAEGSVSNSGFLYRSEKAIPAIAEIEDKPLVLDDTIVDLRNEIAREYGHEFCQILIQLENATGKIKIDFEFDNPDRWKIVPSKLKEMREALRPKFS